MPLKLTPAPFPPSSLRNEYVYKATIKKLGNRDVRKIREIFDFKLVGLDFFSHRSSILAGIDSKKLLSSKLGGLIALVRDLPQGCIDNEAIRSLKGVTNEAQKAVILERAAARSVEKIRIAAQRNGLDVFLRQFDRHNFDEKGITPAEIPFVFYQYALIRELNLVKNQVTLLEKNSRLFLEKDYTEVPEVVQSALDNRKAAFQEVLDLIVDYTRSGSIHQILALKSGRTLNTAESDHSTRPFVSKFRGISIGGVISSDQLLSYESYDAAIKEALDNRRDGEITRGAFL